ncbi:hypothetical protein HMPREF1427_01086 [Helicobacter pylori GAM83Bi]|nr:hypothetical protein HMPREF1427_01086 [Helicobacter pylori GAM83Bi]EMH37825.1 hypothetical protein HMPREF1428_01516 [Helicobacter pylori GAM83T]
MFEFQSTLIFNKIGLLCFIVLNFIIKPIFQGNILHFYPLNPQSNPPNPQRMLF